MNSIRNVLGKAMRPSTLAAIVADIDTCLEDTPATTASETLRMAALGALVDLVGEEQADILVAFERSH